MFTLYLESHGVERNSDQMYIYRWKVKMLNNFSVYLFISKNKIDVSSELISLYLASNIDDICKVSMCIQSFNQYHSASYNFWFHLILFFALQLSNYNCSTAALSKYKNIIFFNEIDGSVTVEAEWAIICQVTSVVHNNTENFSKLTGLLHWMSCLDDISWYRSYGHLLTVSEVYANQVRVSYKLSQSDLQLATKNHVQWNLWSNFGSKTRSSIYSMCTQVNEWKYNLAVHKLPLNLLKTRPHKHSPSRYQHRLLQTTACGQPSIYI